MALSKLKYTKWLADLKQNINQQQLQSAWQVNSNMLLLYWYLGKEINHKVFVEEWGKGVVNTLADDLQKAFPKSKGFSVRSMVYMQQFAKSYPDLLITQQPAALMETTKKNTQKRITQQPAALMKTTKTSTTKQLTVQLGNIVYDLLNPLLISIPWGHHMLLLDKLKENKERIWYIKKAIENKWSRSVLQYQIDTDLYARQFKNKKHSNFHLTLPKAQSDLANEMLKDSYMLDFFVTGENITERELEQNLINHIQQFLVELGAGFAFVGRQYKLKIGRKEHFIDLLFYHLHLHSYIVIELKMGEFELAHTGQMCGYLNIINEQVKSKIDNPTLGIILCSSKDEVEVDFALRNINHPIGVSDYQFKKMLPKNLKDKIPSAKQLQDEVKKFLNKNKNIK